MHRLRANLLVLFVTAVLAGGIRAQAADNPADRAVTCDLPADLTTPDSPLPHVAAAMAAGRPVQVLAIGSGSTVGDATGNVGPAFVYSRPGSSFPFEMIDALRTARPAGRFELTIRGARNMTAGEMLPLLREALAAGHFDLVVWQTGTVEAVRGLRPETMRDTLLAGIKDAEGAGADVIIVDPQFSRFLRANADVGPYEAVLRQTAAATSAALFRRFDLTQTWATTGRIDLERASRSAREAKISELTVCLGRALAAFVLNGAGGTPATTH